VYVPVFTNVSTSERSCTPWSSWFWSASGCAAGRFAATRPVIARPLARWGDILLPMVLITIGLLILIERAPSAFKLLPAL
jgi:cadmium resistance protein CadD (predicted permease)